MKKDYYNDKKDYYVEVMKKIETRSVSSVSRSPRPSRSRSRSISRSHLEQRNCKLCKKKI